jgi:hypothetical protein
VVGYDGRRHSTQGSGHSQMESVTNASDVNDTSARLESDSELSSVEDDEDSPSVSSSKAGPTPTSIKIKRPFVPGTPNLLQSQVPASTPSAISSSSISAVPDFLTTTKATNSSNTTGSSDKRPRSEDDLPQPDLTEQDRPSKMARNDSMVQPNDKILSRLQDVSDPEFGRHLLGLITRHVTISGNLQEATTSNHDLKTEVERQKVVIQALKDECGTASARIGEVEKERDAALDGVKSAKAERETYMAAVKSELDGLKANHQEMEKERDEAVESAKLAKESQDKVVKDKEELGQEVFLLIKELELTKAKLAGSEVSQLSLELNACELTFRTMRRRWRS